MHSVRGRLVGATVTAVLSCTSADVAAQSDAAVATQTLLMAPDSRVRGATQRIMSVLMLGAALSEPLRGVIATIGVTDERLHVAEGRCSQLLRACFVLTLTITGEDRLMSLAVDPGGAGEELISSVGHE